MDPLSLGSALLVVAIFSSNVTKLGMHSDVKKSTNPSEESTSLVAFFFGRGGGGLATAQVFVFLQPRFT